MYPGGGGGAGVGDYRSLMQDSSYTTSSPPFFLRDSRASETRRAWKLKITPREKGEKPAGREIFLSPYGVSPFLAWGDSHARREDEWGTTRILDGSPQRKAVDLDDLTGK